MAKGTVIPDEVKTMIAQLYLEHPQWKTHEIRSELLKQIAQRLPHAEPDWPGMSAVQKELAELRKRNRARPLEMQELDMPWSSLSLIRHPIPPQALPLVLKLSVYKRENKKKALTIREALWASRYSAVTKDIPHLFLFCAGMAILEATSEITNTPVNCHSIDITLYTIATGDEVDYKRRKALLKVKKQTIDAFNPSKSFFKLILGEDPFDEKLFEEGGDVIE